MIREPSEVVTRVEKCAYCLTDTIVVTVEQLVSTRGAVVSSTVLSTASARVRGASARGCRGSQHVASIEASAPFSATVTVRCHTAFTEIHERAYTHQSP
jgi:hypothetical protein